MGAGAALDLCTAFGLEIKEVDSIPEVGSCVKSTASGRTFYNLITTEESGHLPNYTDFMQSVYLLRDRVTQNNVTSLSITRLGCGRDRFNWDHQVRPFLYQFFQGLPMIFHVYVT
jgi:hypothetical protein